MSTHSDRLRYLSRDVPVAERPAVGVVLVDAAGMGYSDAVLLSVEERDALLAENQQKDSENQRLRDALGEVITLCERHGAVRTAVATARAALAAVREENE